LIGNDVGFNWTFRLPSGYVINTRTVLAAPLQPPLTDVDG